MKTLTRAVFSLASILGSIHLANAAGSPAGSLLSADQEQVDRIALGL